MKFTSAETHQKEVEALKGLLKQCYWTIVQDPCKGCGTDDVIFYPSYGEVFDNIDLTGHSPICEGMKFLLALEDAIGTDFLLKEQRAEHLDFIQQNQ